MESADPRGPACGSMEGEKGKGVILTKSYLPGGAALCRRSIYPCSFGVAFGVQKLSSRGHKSQIL